MKEENDMGANVTSMLIEVTFLVYQAWVTQNLDLKGFTARPL